jgi:hypothetical protein
MPDHQDLFLVPMQGSLQLARDSIHFANGEVQMNGNGCPNVFQHRVALDWFGFQEGLIDKNGHVFAGTKRSQRLG